ncbi:hypothetical protein HDV62DRAFT_378873 [Trichoderma sp. SZMC 28011]
MQIGHGVVRHTRKRAAARQYEYLWGTRRKSDLLRYETLQPQSLLGCRRETAVPTVDSSHWPSPIHGFLRGTPRSGPGAASLVVGAWRDVTLLLCICVMPVPVQQYEHTHHPLLPPVIVVCTVDRRARPFISFAGV